MDKTTLERMDLTALERALATARLGRIKHRLMGRAHAAIEQAIPYVGAASLFGLFGLVVLACAQADLISTHPALCMALCLAAFIAALVGSAMLINGSDERRRHTKNTEIERELELGFVILGIKDEIKKRSGERTMLLEKKELNAASHAGRSGSAPKRI